MEEETVLDCLNKLLEKLERKKAAAEGFVDIAGLPVALGQCVYILHFESKEIVFQDGFSKLLGYNIEKFSFENIKLLLHTHDSDMVNYLDELAFSSFTENNNPGNSYFITYRIKSRNKGYIKVLQQSNLLDLFGNGKMSGSINVLTDISFIDSSDTINWKFTVPAIDKRIREHFVREKKMVFSDREQEVLKLLNSGSTSSEIASKLFISKHTVDGHRRKMLHKSSCTNTIDLINFCKKNGIL